MVTIETHVVTPFYQNARIISDQLTKRAVVVDPGGDVDKLLQPLARAGLVVEAILLTHFHIDHCGGVAALLRKLASQGAIRPKLIGGDERELRESVTIQAEFFGFSGAAFENCPAPDLLLTPGVTIDVLGRPWQARFTPGHSPGHYSFVSPADMEFQIIEDSKLERGTGQIVIAGDALFAGAIGRTDFPGCSERQLLESIHRELLSLADEAIVLPGHGPKTTIGTERKTNPFLVPFLRSAGNS